MQHIKGPERDQSQVLPARVDDYVHAENPVRFIDAFVDRLDLGAAGFGRVQPKETGRPGYDPANLLRLYIYGYLNRVRSSRRLEAETHRNRGRGAIRQQIDPSTPLRINDDCAVAASAALCPVINPDDARIGPQRQRQSVEQAQRGASPALCLGQPARAPGEGSHQLRYALGEGLAGTGGVAAVEPTHAQADADRPPKGRQVGGVPTIAAVYGPAHRAAI